MAVLDVVDLHRLGEVLVGLGPDHVMSIMSPLRASVPSSMYHCRVSELSGGSRRGTSEMSKQAP